VLFITVVRKLIKKSSLIDVDGKTNWSVLNIITNSIGFTTLLLAEGLQVNSNLSFKFQLSFVSACNGRLQVAFQRDGLDSVERAQLLLSVRKRCCHPRTGKNI
jgi:hypothetical protein